MSPPAQKQKRSWQSSSSRNRRSSPPAKKNFKSPPRFRQFSSNHPHRSRSRSPKYQKQSVEGSTRGKDDFKSRSPNRADKQGFRSRQEGRSRKRSMSPRSSSRTQHDHNRVQGYNDELKQNVVARSPDSTRHHGPSSKKKSRQSSPSMNRKFSHGRSPSPASPPSKKQETANRAREREESIPQRKVSSLNKKKTTRISLHRRFTSDESEQFELDMRDNVTIAILRNPHAEPSEDVTVQQIFDSALFKMVHKKSEGRRPIFDREEIKVWKHDENLEDDPDFEERRLVRVKSVPRKSVDSLKRMSPDVLRKSFGLNMKTSKSQSPRRSPTIRLNAQPDPRYESRYQEHLSKEDTNDGRRRKEDGKRGDSGRGGREEKKDWLVSPEDEKSVRDNRYSRKDDYDLRQALERRRSGRDEHQDDDRNVVVDQERGRYRSIDDEDRKRRGGWMGEKSRGWGRNRGRGPRHRWSPRRNEVDDGKGQDPRERGYDRKDRYSLSPGSTRGRDHGGYRGRGHGKGSSQYEADRNSPPADDYFKYAQHDDRDVSPQSFRVRGRGGRFQSRGFRGNIRGFRGGRRGRGFRSSWRGRGFIRRENSMSREKDDRRSVEHASEREWKHDMYDSVQSDEDELPHSTTVNN